MSITVEQKNQFDHMNKYSYLFRLQLERNGFGISMKTINGCDAYFIIYRAHVIAAVSFGELYANFSIYKYLRKLFPSLDDFRMSDYFSADQSRYEFDRSDAYFRSIRTALDTIPETVPADEQAEVKEAFDDVKARLMGFLVSDDISDSFAYGDGLPMNILRHDISMALGEISRLETELRRKSDAIKKVFLSA